LTPSPRTARQRRFSSPRSALAAARAEAFGVEVVRIPSPGLLTREGVVEPASYVNFAITTHLVVVPTFGSPHDADGVAAIAALFPDRDTIGLTGAAVLAGGGGFHCASQQMPAAPYPS
jgi:agmatine deiminase